MAEIVPTVLAATAKEYGPMLERAESLSRRVHVDVTDGVFAQGKTVGIGQVHAGRETVIDLHLMVKHPEEYLETAMSLHPGLITFHAEADGDVLGCVAKVQAAGIKAGVAVLPATEIEHVRALVTKADHVLVFTGNLGYNGGEFQRDQLHKIAQIHAIHPEAEVSVDGGINAETASLAVRAGVNVLYAGSYLQTASKPKQAFQELVDSVQGAPA